MEKSKNSRRELRTIQFLILALLIKVGLLNLHLPLCLFLSKEGREEERKKLALSMLKDYFNVEVIVKHTGLLEKELQALAKEHGLKLKYSV